MCFVVVVVVEDGEEVFGSKLVARGVATRVVALQFALSEFERPHSFPILPNLSWLAPQHRSQLIRYIVFGLLGRKHYCISS